jgi:hypothetical protein
MSLMLVAGVAALTALVAAQEVQPWVHVQIEGGSGENANINLPVAALEAVLSMAPDTVVADGQVRVGQDQGISVSALRETWLQLRTAGDMEFLTVQDGEQTVRVARSGDMIELRVDGNDGNVRADLPVAIVDALLSSEGETLNISAAIAELKNLRGDIIHVTSEDQQIRVWIDEVAEQ